MEIAEKAYSGLAIEPLQVLSARDSYPQLHRFNRFRNELAFLNHPFALAAKDLIARREQLPSGAWALTFSPSGLYEKTVFSPSIQNPGFPLEAEEREREIKKKVQNYDPAERLVEKMLRDRREGITELKKEDAFLSCQHEWGDYACLHCGVPTPEEEE